MKPLREAISGGRDYRLKLMHDREPVPYAQVIQGLCEDASFREFFNDLLADSPFSAFRWETPALSRSTLNRPFECVFLNAPGLSRRPNRREFAEHFKEAPDKGAVRFANLGGDAILVVPVPQDAVPPEAYGHLGAFVRGAPAAQRDALWKLVGQAMQERLAAKDAPVWLSTAGGGVAWLHVRLDDQPKYYSHTPYQMANTGPVQPGTPSFQQ